MTRNPKKSWLFHLRAPEAAQRLVNYSFPGNVRELENIIASAVMTEAADMLTSGSLGDLMDSSKSELPDELPLISLAELEKRHIDQVLKYTGNNRKQAASILGISVRTLQRKIN